MSLVYSGVQTGQYANDQSLVDLLLASESFKKLIKPAQDEMKKRLLALPEDKKKQAYQILQEERISLNKIERTEQKHLQEMVDEYLIKIQGIKMRFKKDMRLKAEKRAEMKESEKEKNILAQLDEKKPVKIKKSK